MIDFLSVGKKLTQYRKKYNLTQDEIAERLFVTRQLVSKWENGTGVPSIDCLLELCKLYETTFEDILCLNELEKWNKPLIFIFQKKNKKETINDL